MDKISVDCPNCGSTLKASHEFAGTVAPCPKCSAKVRVPVDLSAPQGSLEPVHSGIPPIKRDVAKPPVHPTTHVKAHDVAVSQPAPKDTLATDAKVPAPSQESALVRRARKQSHISKAYIRASCLILGVLIVVGGAAYYYVETRVTPERIVSRIEFQSVAPNAGGTVNFFLTYGSLAKSEFKKVNSRKKSKKAVSFTKSIREAMEDACGNSVDPVALTMFVLKDDSLWNRQKFFVERGKQYVRRAKSLDEDALDSVRPTLERAGGKSMSSATVLAYLIQEDRLFYGDGSLRTWRFQSLADD